MSKIRQKTKRTAKHIFMNLACDIKARNNFLKDIDKAGSSQV